MICSNERITRELGNESSTSILWHESTRQTPQRILKANKRNC